MKRTDKERKRKIDDLENGISFLLLLFLSQVVLVVKQVIIVRVAAPHLEGHLIVTLGNARREHEIACLVQTQGSRRQRQKKNGRERKKERVTHEYNVQQVRTRQQEIRLQQTRQRCRSVQLSGLFSVHPLTMEETCVWPTQRQCAIGGGAMV